MHYNSMIMNKKSLVACVLFTFLQFAMPPMGICAQSSKESLTVAIIPHRSNLGNEEAYGALFKELEKETGITFEWIGSKTYDDVIKNINAKKADIAYVGPFAYVNAQDNFGVRLICRSLSRNNEEFYHSIIITRKDSGINTLQDLRGKSFAFTDKKSTSGYLFPLTQLKKAGVELEDFSDVKYLKRQANSLLAVYKAHVDAGATSYTAIDKVKININEIKILWKSEPIYRGPWIARKDLPDEQFNKIKKAMLKISQKEGVDTIFQGLTTKGFVEVDDSDYSNIREVVQLLHAQK